MMTTSSGLTNIEKRIRACGRVVSSYRAEDWNDVELDLDTRREPGKISKMGDFWRTY